MRRRDILALFGCLPMAWPLAAGAQPSERTRRLGILYGADADDEVSQARNTAFLKVLQDRGWTGGRNVQIETRWAAGDADRTSKFATELAAMAPDVIFATGTPMVAALLRATRTVPIVFATVPDPVGAGFVDSLAKPGGNATGFTNFDYSLAAKWLELLKQIAPATTRAAVLRDPAATSGMANGLRFRPLHVPWYRADPDQCDRYGRNRAIPRGVFTCAQWWHDRDGKFFNSGPPQANRRAGGPLQIAGRLFRTLHCRGRWFALLWA